MAKVKLDQAIADSIDEARAAVEAYAAQFPVGEHVGCTAEADRVATHAFECTHPGYPGWRWLVTMARASRGRAVTIDEITLAPADGSLVAPSWVPWADRIDAGDVAPGTLMPTPDNDPRLEPGYTGGEDAADADPAEGTQTRAIVAELGLGRERVLSVEGRAQAARRWRRGPGGPTDEHTADAPGPCETCGYFIRLRGSMGALFGVCANVYSPSDARVVTVDHGCGGHSDVVAPEREPDERTPAWDTITVDEWLFD